MWTDTPLARLFCVEEDWHLLKSRAILEQVCIFSFSFFPFSFFLSFPLPPFLIIFISLSV